MRLQRFASAVAAGCLAATCLAAAGAPPAPRAPEPLRLRIEAAPEDFVVREPDADVLYFWPFAGPPGPVGAPARTAPGERPRFVRVRAFPEAAQPPKLEKAAYLGVSTSPCPQVLRQQLKLPRGIGLVVDVVEEGSPAQKAGLKPYDVLHKLDDQLLVDAHQLAVLVRTHKPGDEVKLTVVREGKAETVAATLAEKEMRPLEEMRFGEFDAPPPVPFGPGGGGGAPGWQQLRIPVPVEPPDPNVLVRPRRGGVAPQAGLSFLWDDGQTTMTFTVRDGKRHLEAKDRSGKVLFEGPIDTEEQRAKLPTDLREKIEKIRIETLPFPGQPPGGLDLRDPRGRRDDQRRGPPPLPPRPSDEKQPQPREDDSLDLRDKPDEPAEREEDRRKSGDEV